MKPIEIDINEYKQTGAGANGISYDSLKDSSIMLKMYNSGYDTAMIWTESEVARKVYEIGVPTPEPGEVVTDGERIGIRFRRIDGKRSFARAISEEPERLEEFTREYAVWCKKLHSVKCPEGVFPDAKKGFLRLLDASRFFNETEKTSLRDFLVNSVPESMNALHGDMHFGNVLTTLPKGAPLDTPHSIYFIDLGYFSHGFPLLDLGMTSCVCKRSGNDYLTKELHFDSNVALESWEYFRDEYFFGPEKLGEKLLGPSVNSETVDEVMDVYTVIKLLLVEYNCGSLPESFHAFAREVVRGLIK